jgi:hypothetical protein
MPWSRSLHFGGSVSPRALTNGSAIHSFDRSTTRPQALQTNMAIFQMLPSVEPQSEAGTDTRIEREYKCRGLQRRAANNRMQPTAPLPVADAARSRLKRGRSADLE